LRLAAQPRHPLSSPLRTLATKTLSRLCRWRSLSHLGGGDPLHADSHILPVLGPKWTEPPAPGIAAATGPRLGRGQNRPSPWSAATSRRCCVFVCVCVCVCARARARVRFSFGRRSISSTVTQRQCMCALVRSRSRVHYYCSHLAHPPLPTMFNVIQKKQKTGNLVGTEAKSL